MLPLKKDLKSIAVIGPNADDVMNQLGDYSPKKVLQHVTTMVEGIRATVSPQTKVTLVRGCEVLGGDKTGFDEAVQAAKNSEVAIVVVGERQHVTNTDDRHNRPTDGEGHDVASLDLTGYQEDQSKRFLPRGHPPWWY